MLDFPFSFVHFSFSTALLGFLFLSFRSYWFCLTAAVSACVFTFVPTFFPLSPTWFLMYSFLVLVLDLLIVFFRSTLLRSHSCSSGDSLDYSLGPVLDFRFSTNYSAFCSFFSLLPELSWQRFVQCLFPPQSTVACFPLDCGTQHTAISFTDYCFTSQWLHQHQAWPCGFSFEPWLAL